MLYAPAVPFGIDVIQLLMSWETSREPSDGIEWGILYTVWFCDADANAAEKKSSGPAPGEAASSAETARRQQTGGRGGPDEGPTSQPGPRVRGAHDAHTSVVRTVTLRRARLRITRRPATGQPGGERATRYRTGRAPGHAFGFGHGSSNEA